MKKTGFLTYDVSSDLILPVWDTYTGHFGIEGPTLFSLSLPPLSGIGRNG